MGQSLVDHAADVRDMKRRLGESITKIKDSGNDNWPMYQLAVDEAELIAQEGLTLSWRMMARLQEIIKLVPLISEE